MSEHLRRSGSNSKKRLSFTGPTSTVSNKSSILFSHQTDAKLLVHSEFCLRSPGTKPLFQPPSIMADGSFAIRQGLVRVEVHTFIDQRLREAFKSILIEFVIPSPTLEPKWHKSLGTPRRLKLSRLGQFLPGPRSMSEKPPPKAPKHRFAAVVHPSFPRPPGAPDG